MEQGMACAENSQGKTSSATAGQTDLDSKAAATSSACCAAHMLEVVWLFACLMTAAVLAA